MKTFFFLFLFFILAGGHLFSDLEEINLPPNETDHSLLKSMDNDKDSLQAQGTTVCSDLANYDGHLLVLKGNVSVEHPMGHLLAQNAVLKKESSSKKGFEFPWISLTDEVSFQFKEGGTLHCSQVDIDSTIQKAYFIGQPQLVYLDQLGELKADAAEVDYVEENHHVILQKVALKGSVNLIRGKDTSSSSLFFQYALADFVDYFPQEKQMVLSSKDLGQVLFYDPSKEMQLSAKTIFASFNEEGKESLRGVGNVRFTFKQEELEQLKEKFHWE